MLCPKCRQPLEGEESYICCADAAVSWKCGECGKVSEGFAFPYGTCPLCGGKLTMLGDREIEDVGSLVGVRTAFEIELGGRAFYARAAQEATDPAMSELFSKLAAMEEEHMATLSRRYHVAAPDPSVNFRTVQAAIFAGIDNKPEDPGNLLRVAIAFEQRAASFFAACSETAPEGSVEHDLYKELAAEEVEHAALLTTEYERWKAGKQGIL